MNGKERQWCEAASRRGGSFVKTFAMACYCADDANYALLRPVLTQLIAKYPTYLTAEPYGLDMAGEIDQQP